jgi:hypothetical protein
MLYFVNLTKISKIKNQESHSHLIFDIKIIKINHKESNRIFYSYSTISQV